MYPSYNMLGFQNQVPRNLRHQNGPGPDARSLDMANGPHKSTQPPQNGGYGPLKSPTFRQRGQPQQSVNMAMFGQLQPPVAQKVPYGPRAHDQSSVPQTPFDLNYGQLMLPRNLLMLLPFIGSPMTAALSPGASFQSLHYVPVSGPAPPILQAPPKARKKGKADENTKSTKPLASKVVLFQHISPTVKMHEFLSFLKFGPVQFCYISSSDETECRVKLKFVYEKTQSNFLKHLHLYLEDFRLEFKSPHATYRLVNYEPAADDVAATVVSDVPVDLVHEIEVNHATRCIKVPKYTMFELLNDDHENLEKKLRLQFGDVDVINTNEDRNNSMTVHFLNMVSCVRLFQNLAKTCVEKIEADPEIAKKLPKFKYLSDRCCQIDDDEFELTFTALDVSEHPENESTPEIFVPAQGSYPNMQMELLPPMIQNVNSLNATDNRTVYLGNLTLKTTVEEICNVVRGGILQLIKLMLDKHICFITFVSAALATQFYALSNMNGLMIHNKKIKVGWGKNPGELPNLIALAVTVGASRNVYIGVKEEDEGNGPRVVPEEAVLRRDFSRWGDIEQINFFKDGYCAFVNFMNISSAIKVIEEFQGPDAASVHASLDNRYVHYKINFAKDRCGNPPKFTNKPKRKKKREPEHVMEEPLSDQKALALALIGITSAVIDEKVKEAEETGSPVIVTGTTPVSNTPVSGTPLAGTPSQASPARLVSPGVVQNNSPAMAAQQNAYMYQPYQQYGYGDYGYMPQMGQRRPQRNSVGMGFGSNNGSSIMAQYLAKAQFDSLMFNPSKEDKKKRRSMKK